MRFFFGGLISVSYMGFMQLFCDCVGLTPSGNDQAYFHHDITKLKELYKQYLLYITFEKKIEIRSLNTEDGKKLAELEKSLEKKDQELLKANQEILGTKLRLETLERYIADLQKATSVLPSIEYAIDR